MCGEFNVNFKKRIFLKKLWEKIKQTTRWDLVDLLPGEAAGDAVFESITQRSLSTWSGACHRRQNRILAILHHRRNVRGGRGYGCAGMLHYRRLLLLMVLMIMVMVQLMGWAWRARRRWVSVVQMATDRAVTRWIFTWHYSSLFNMFFFRFLFVFFFFYMGIWNCFVM